MRTGQTFVSIARKLDILILSFMLKKRNHPQRDSGPTTGTEGDLNQDDLRRNQSKRRRKRNRKISRKVENLPKESEGKDLEIVPYTGELEGKGSGLDTTYLPEEDGDSGRESSDTREDDETSRPVSVKSIAKEENSEDKRLIRL